MVGRGTCLLVLGSATACNLLFGIDELRFETATGGASSVEASSSPTSTVVSTTGSGGNGGMVAGGGGTGGTACGYAASVLMDQPVGYFRLGEASGTIVVDEVSSQRGSYSDGVTLGQPGAIGCDNDTAAAFDGFSGEANLGARFEFIEGASFTLEAWANAAIVDDSYRPILAKEFISFPLGRNGYFLWVHANDGLGFELVTASMPDVAQTMSVPTGSWMHVVGTYDGAETCLYVNKMLQACEPIETQLFIIQGPFKIGAFSQGSDHFAGLVDEVAVYDKVLDEARIEAHFDAANP